MFVKVLNILSHYTVLCATPSRNEMNSTDRFSPSAQARATVPGDPPYHDSSLLPFPGGILSSQVSEVLPQVRADLPPIWPLVLLVLMFSDFRNLHMFPFPLWCLCRGLRGFRAEQGERYDHKVGEAHSCITG